MRWPPASRRASSLRSFPLGFHFIIAAVLCWVIAGNLVAAALGAVFFGNPLTFPAAVGRSWETGKLILHDRLPAHGPPAHLGEMLHTLSFAQLWHPVLEPMLIGAVPLGLVFGLLFYGITRWGMTVFPRAAAQAAGRTRKPPCAVVHPGGSIGSAARMIIGIGSDLIDIRRIEKSLERHGERFIQRILHRGRAGPLREPRRPRAASYAKRFAAKEACAKALGTGLAQGVFWRDMGVVNLPSGAPTMALTGGAAARLDKILPKGIGRRSTSPSPMISRSLKPL